MGLQEVIGHFRGCGDSAAGFFDSLVLEDLQQRAAAVIRSEWLENTDLNNEQQPIRGSLSPLLIVSSAVESIVGYEPVFDRQHSRGFGRWVT